jgi:hypothetical protein
MKTLKKVPLELVIVDEYMPKILEMEFGKLYYSKQYEITNHLCVCGCGQQVPLTIRNGEWNLSVINSKLNISPSILLRNGCKSHYIISNGIANII